MFYHFNNDPLIVPFYNKNFICGKMVVELSNKISKDDCYAAKKSKLPIKPPRVL